MKLSNKEIDDIRVATLLHDMENIEVTSKVIQKAIGSNVIRTVRYYVNLITDHPDPPSPQEAIMILRNELDDEHHPAVLRALEQLVLAEHSQLVVPDLQKVAATSVTATE